MLTRLGLRPAPVPPARNALPAAAPVTDRRRQLPPAAAASHTGVVGARRPLVDTTGALAGFEFHVSPALIERLRRDSEHPAARAVVTSVLGAMRSSLAPGRMALAELPAPWLAATTSCGS